MQHVMARATPKSGSGAAQNPRASVSTHPAVPGMGVWGGQDEPQAVGAAWREGGELLALG